MFDIESGQPVPRADALPRGAERHGETFTGELPRSVVESDSGAQASLGRLFGDLTTTRARTARPAASPARRSTTGWWTSSSARVSSATPA